MESMQEHNTKRVILKNNKVDATGQTFYYSNLTPILTLITVNDFK